jgi:hypothetical protein
VRSRVLADVELSGSPRPHDLAQGRLVTCRDIAALPRQRPQRPLDRARRSPDPVHRRSTGGNRGKSAEDETLELILEQDREADLARQPAA